ncbi:hypothetical protein CY34DRAFT_92729, partial [Suillus luteus UH-Slu-Lm8-n1]
MSSGNWTRPDNVFGSAHTLDSFISCNTAPRRRPPCTDHVPILSNLALDWDKFQGSLSHHLRNFPGLRPIMMEAQFQEVAANLNTAIKLAIQEKIPQMMKKKNKQSHLSYKFRALPDYPIHEEHQIFCNRLMEEICKTRQEHWISFLEDLDQHSVYTANRYVSSPSGDGGRTSIPVLKSKSPDNTLIEATTNNQK